jgi:hypothetical protein
MTPPSCSDKRQNGFDKRKRRASSKASALVQHAAGADDWKLLRAEHGIEVYRAELPGSGMVAMKGTGAIDAPLWKIAFILLGSGNK